MFFMLVCVKWPQLALLSGSQTDFMLLTVLLLYDCPVECPHSCFSSGIQCLPFVSLMRLVSVTLHYVWELLESATAYKAA